MRINKYDNACIVKLKNTHIRSIKVDRGFLIQFLTIGEKDDVNKPRAIHRVLKNKVTETSITLTNKGAMALLISLMDMVVIDKK